MAATLDAVPVPAAASARRRLMALYLMLGFSAGLPFYMFSTILTARLTDHGVVIAVIGFFAWVQLLPTLKFVWAPLLDRYDVPGFARYWGRRRGWIMLAQLGIVTSLAAMTLTSADASLAVTALFAVLLAFWTTTLEVAADAWRIELAPTPAQQGPITAGNLWGYRSAMVAAGSGALLVADRPEWGWSGAYLAITLVAALPLPVLAALPRDAGGSGRRGSALATGLAASGGILLATAVAVAAAGWAILAAATGIGISAKTNVTPWVLGVCMLPFVAMAVAVPRIRTLPPSAPLRRSVVLGPYIDFFWRFGFASIVIMAFVSLNRMGDVLALNLSKPMILGLGYTKTEIGRADGLVALAASMIGVGLGGWLVTRWRQSWTLGLGALTAAIGNFGFVWLAHRPLGETTLYIATAADQFGNGLAGTVFVVYLSMLVNPRYPGAQYAFLSGFAFMLARLLAGAGGTIVERIGYDDFFLLSGLLSLAAIPFLPVIATIRPRKDDLGPDDS